MGPSSAVLCETEGTRKERNYGNKPLSQGLEVQRGETLQSTKILYYCHLKKPLSVVKCKQVGLASQAEDASWQKALKASSCFTNSPETGCPPGKPKNQEKTFKSSPSLLTGSWLERAKTQPPCTRKALCIRPSSVHQRPAREQRDGFPPRISHSWGLAGAAGQACCRTWRADNPCLRGPAGNPLHLSRLSISRDTGPDYRERQGT